MVSTFESVYGCQPVRHGGFSITELTQDRDTATKLRSGFVQSHTIIAASLACRNSDGTVTAFQGITPLRDWRTFAKCVRKADHFSVAET